MHRSAFDVLELCLAQAASPADVTDPPQRPGAIQTDFPDTEHTGDAYGSDESDETDTPEDTIVSEYEPGHQRQMTITVIPPSPTQNQGSARKSRRKSKRKARTQKPSASAHQTLVEEAKRALAQIRQAEESLDQT